MFKTKPVNTQTLGEYLASLRRHLGTSIAEISKVAQIPPKYIASLEQGDYTKLPAVVYVKGFLKTLAHIYRVEEKKLLSLFAAEKGLADWLSLKSEPPPRSVPRFVFSPRTLAVAGVVFLGFASLAYLYFQVNSVRQSPTLEVVSPGEDGIADTSFLVLEGRTEAGASVFLNNQPVVVDASGNFRENLSLAPGTNQLVVKAVGKFNKETAVMRQVVIPEKKIAGAFDESPSSTSTEPSLASGVELEILVGPKTSSLSIEVDGQDIFTGTMLPGSSRVVRGDFVRVSTGNAGATRVVLNGQDLGFLGKEGETLRDVEFTK